MDRERAIRKMIARMIVDDGDESAQRCCAPASQLPFVIELGFSVLPRALDLLTVDARFAFDQQWTAPKPEDNRGKICWTTREVKHFVNRFVNTLFTVVYHKVPGKKGSPPQAQLLALFVNTNTTSVAAVKREATAGGASSSSSSSGGGAGATANPVFNVPADTSNWI